MSGAHSHGAGDGLVVHRHGPVHGLPPHGKLLGLLAFVLVVVATPVPAVVGSRGWLPYLGYGVLLVGLVAVARLPFGAVARRCVVEAPFLVFALLMPFVAAGPRVQVGPLALSESGLVGGLALAVKATLGVGAAVVLAATTPTRELLAGLERLRLPAALVAICSFMVRYVSVVAGDAARMRVARESRGYTGGRAGHLAAVAAGAGTLFVRSYERGERVHLAMLSRGYDGRMPPLDVLRPGARAHASAGVGSAGVGSVGVGSAGVGSADVASVEAAARAAYRRDWLRCALLPGAAAIVLLASGMMGL